MSRRKIVPPGGCQRWRERTHSWRYTSEGGFDPDRYVVAAIPEASARQFVLTHHYAQTFVAARRCYGLYDGVLLVGAAVLSVPGGPSVLRAAFDRIDHDAEGAELGRFVLLDEVPADAETWFLARAFRLARMTGIRAIVSFCDPMPRVASDGRVIFPGHRGAIYQAASAIYTGRTKPETVYLLPDTRLLHRRSLTKLPKVEQLLRRAGATPAHHPGNHRYCFALDRGVRLRYPSLDYPKSEAA